MEKLSKICFIGIMLVLTFGILAGLIRAIRGPRRADRILGINVIGSLSTAMLAVLAVYLKENWLLDVSLVYGLMSFLSVVVLARIHISAFGRRQDDSREGFPSDRNGKKAASETQKKTEEAEEELV